MDDILRNNHELVKQIGQMTETINKLDIENVSNTK